MAPQPSSRAVTLAYVAPFGAYIGIMAVEQALSTPPAVAYPVRFFLVSALVLAISQPYWMKRPSRPMASLLLGTAVFFLWIAPDVLFGYRYSWPFNNLVTGTATSSISPELRAQAWFVIVRTLSCTALVPVVEELFWRGWLMRWMIHPHFTEVPLGKYRRSAFWTVAVLFGIEHGPYWEVGLVTGVIYNWWMVRTQNLGDCILMHAATNGLLSTYVVVSGKWEYLF